MIGIVRHFKRVTFWLVCLGIGVLPHTAFAVCGYDRVDVAGEKAEVMQSCQALEEVLGYFRKLGFTVEPKVRLSFHDRVYVDVFNETATPSQRQVSGFYDADAREIQVTSASSEDQRARRPWGVQWGETIAYSLLQHELIHMTVREVLRGTHAQWARVWLEYLAYAVQFDLMDDKLKAEIMRNYPNAASFETVAEVNPMIYGFDPDLFGLRAYLHVKMNGGAEFVRKLLAGDVEFTTRELLWTR